MIKKVLIILFIALLGLTACSTTTSNSPEPKPTPTYEAPAMTDEDYYLETLRELDNYIINYTSDSDLLELGYGVCEVLDYGYTVDEIITELVYNMDLTTDDDYEFVGATIGASVAWLCPEYLDQVDAYF